MAFHDVHDDVPKLIRQHLDHLGDVKDLTPAHKAEVVKMLQDRGYEASYKEIMAWSMTDFEDFLVNHVFQDEEEEADQKEVSYTLGSTLTMGVGSRSTLREDLLKELEKEILTTGLTKWLDSRLIEFDVVEE